MCRAGSLIPPLCWWRAQQELGPKAGSAIPLSSAFPLPCPVLRLLSSVFRSTMAQLGKRSLLPIVRAAQPGLYLDGGSHGEILLPARYIPAGAVPGGKLEVFVYRDSEDRLVATTERPHAVVGEFAYLKVVGVNPRIGVFL